MMIVVTLFDKPRGPRGSWERERHARNICWFDHHGIGDHSDDDDGIDDGPENDDHDIDDHPDDDDDDDDDDIDNHDIDDDDLYFVGVSPCLSYKSWICPETAMMMMTIRGWLWWW